MEKNVIAYIGTLIIVLTICIYAGVGAIIDVLCKTICAIICIKVICGFALVFPFVYHSTNRRNYIKRLGVLYNYGGNWQLSRKNYFFTNYFVETIEL